MELNGGFVIKIKNNKFMYSTNITLNYFVWEHTLFWQIISKNLVLHFDYISFDRLCLLMFLNMKVNAHNFCSTFSLKDKMWSWGDSIRASNILAYQLSLLDITKEIRCLPVSEIRVIVSEDVGDVSHIIINILTYRYF